MAKKRIVEESVVTLTREVLPNGNIKLKSPLGIKDIRNFEVHSEVICKPENERLFVENTAE